MGVKQREIVQGIYTDKSEKIDPKTSQRYTTDTILGKRDFEPLGVIKVAGDKVWGSREQVIVIDMLYDKYTTSKESTIYHFILTFGSGARRRVIGHILALDVVDEIVDNETLTIIPDYLYSRHKYDIAVFKLLLQRAKQALLLKSDTLNKPRQIVLTHFEIEPKFRGLGLGQLLLRQVIKFFRIERTDLESKRPKNLNIYADITPYTSKSDLSLAIKNLDDKNMTAIKRIEHIFNQNGFLIKDSKAQWLEFGPTYPLKLTFESEPKPQIFTWKIGNDEREQVINSVIRMFRL